MCCILQADCSKLWLPSTDVIKLTLTLKMTTKKVVETSVTVSNSPTQDYFHRGNHILLTHDGDCWDMDLLRVNLFLTVFIRLTALGAY